MTHCGARRCKTEDVLHYEKKKNKIKNKVPVEAQSKTYQKLL